MTELQHICVMIRIEYDNFKISRNAKHYIDELSKLTDIVTEKDRNIALRFLCEATYWETKVGIETKERLMNLVKKQLKIPIYPKIKVK
jgi:hypothetical protein